MSELVYPEESYAILGACSDVYNEKGCGFLEPVNHDCVEIEVGSRKIPFLRERRIVKTRHGSQLFAPIREIRGQPSQ